MATCDPQFSEDDSRNATPAAVALDGRDRDTGSVSACAEIAKAWRSSSVSSGRYDPRMDHDNRVAEAPHSRDAHRVRQGVNTNLDDVAHFVYSH